MSFTKLTGPLQANHQELQDARLHQFSGAKADALAGEVYEDTTIDTPMFVSDGGHLPILAAGSGSPSTIGVNDTASAGTNSRGARIDHKHASPNVATTSVSGFMSSADKTKLDGASDIAAPSQLAKYDASGRLIVEDAVSGKQAVNWQTMVSQISLAQQGLAEKDPCRGLFTTLPTYTYNAGTKRITASANGALAATDDGVGSWAVNDRIFFTGVIGTGSTNAGLYKIIQVGTASLPFILERTSDFGGPGAPVGQRLIGALVQVLEGSEHGDTFWVLTNDSVTLDTTVLVFRKQAAADVDNATIELDSAGNLRTKDGGQTNAKLANMAQETIKGRAVAAGSGAPQDLTPAQAWAVIAKGATAGGTISAGQVLRGDTTNGVDADAKLTFDGLTLGVGDGTGQVAVGVNAGSAAGSLASLAFSAGGSLRFLQRYEVDSDSMVILQRNDDGSGRGTVVKIPRSQSLPVEIGSASTQFAKFASQAGTGTRLVEAAADGTQSATAAVTTFAKSLLDDADAATARTTLGVGSANLLNLDWGYASGGVPAWIKIAQLRIPAQFGTAEFTAVVSDRGISSTNDYGATLLIARIRHNAAMSAPLDIVNVVTAKNGATTHAFGYVIDTDNATEKIVSVYISLGSFRGAQSSVLAYTGEASFPSGQPLLTAQPSGYVAATPASFSAGALTSSALTANLPVYADANKTLQTESVELFRQRIGAAAADGTGLSYKSNIGDGVNATIVKAHGLATADLDVSLTEIATGEKVGCRTVVDSTNVTLYFGSAPAINSYRLLVRKV